ncbi:phosphatase PAP2 family protein [Micromonosporaceae bacterium Da 78-11]
MSLIQEDPAGSAPAEPRTPVPASARPPHRPEPSARALARRAAIRRAVREIVLVGLLFLAYKIGRVAAAGHVTEALANAQDVWRFERLLHLPSEYGLQQAALGHEWLIKVANCYYAYVHFPVTAICLIWMYVWRPEYYLRTRRALAWLTATALVVHLLMPLAPPRMLSAIGMADTGRLYGPAVYGSPAADHLTNQYAAMPSLHFGWALVVAIALIGATESRWRRLWVLHPLVTLLVIVVTGNHYWLDAIVVAALLGVVLAVQSSWRPAALPAIPRPRTSQG